MTTEQPPTAGGPSRSARIRAWAAANKVKAGLAVGVVVLALLGVLGAVAGSPSDSEKTSGNTAASVAASATRSSGAPPRSPAAAESAPPQTEPSASAPASPAAPSASTPTQPSTPVLPMLVGQGLQTAQDTAQAAGYFHFASTDSLGRDRMQILDREWQVCFQDPAPGPVVTDTKITFGVVRVDETCPASPVPADTTSADVGAPAPNVVGRSANVARDAFSDSASVTIRDISGDERLIIVESNWQVCKQLPAAGTPYVGQPVTLGVVKFGESCP